MFKVNQTVFARLEGYPFWPARVISPTAQHLTTLRMQTIPPHQRLVLFYNDNGRYAVMSNSDLRNFDDFHIRRRTQEYAGPYKSELHVAFKDALREHHRTNPHNTNHSYPTTSPDPHARPKKSTSRDLTSPVTGQSEQRPIPLPKNKNLRKQQSCTSSSQQGSPFDALSRIRSTSHIMASRTSTESSQSNQRQDLQCNQQASQTGPRASEISKAPHSPAPHPSQSKQSRNISESVQLRLRLKRKSTISDGHLNASATHPASQTEENHTTQPSAKRRRVWESERDEARDLLPTGCHSSEGCEAGTTNRMQHRSHADNCRGETRNDSFISSPGKSRSKERFELHRRSCSERRSGERGRTPCCNEQTNPLLMDESRQKKQVDSVMRSIAGLAPDRLNGFDSGKMANGNGNDHDSDPLQTRKERKHECKRSTFQLDESDVDLETEGRDRRPERSLSVKRLRRSRETQRTHKQEEQVKRNHVNKRSEDGSPMQFEKISGKRKRKKTDDNWVDPTMPFSKLSKDECVQLILRMQHIERCNLVELWRHGYESADPESILKTEEGLKAACNVAVWKAEELLRAMKEKTEGGDKSGLLETEREAYEACKNLRQIYFDKEKVSLKKMGKRILSVAKELTRHSRKVSTVLRDVLVLWMDLTNWEEGSRERVKKSDVKDWTSSEEGREDSDGRKEKRSEGKKASARREKRMQKFDRKSFYSALESVLEDMGGALEMESIELRRFSRRLEKEIRPTFEEDRLGYYDASVNVIRGIQKVLKRLAVNQEEQEDAKKFEHAATFLSAVKEGGKERTRMLVSQLMKKSR